MRLAAARLALTGLMLLLTVTALADTDLRLDVYVTENCPHCAQAKLWLLQLQRERPDLEVVLHHVDSNPLAREQLAELSRQAGQWPPGVPTFVVGENVLVGFDSAALSGPAVLALLGNGAAPAPRVMESRLLGELSVARLGLPGFTLAMGLIDGFNPCAMWVLLFLLALLVNLRDRARMALIAGTFVLVGGAVYYAFMAAWLNLFLVVGFGPLVRLTLAVLALVIGAINVKDFAAFHRGVSLSIPEAAKPRLYARARAVLQGRNLPASLLAVAALAVLVNFVELLCTAGLPAVYTAVLTHQALPDTAYYGYLGLYILAYLTDDALMVGLAVYSLSRRKLDENTGRWLKLVSGVVMLALGIVLLLRPQWLE